jgi:hypothetical protein
MEIFYFTPSVMLNMNEEIDNIGLAHIWNSHVESNISRL